MISVVIPTLNAETGLAATLTALVPAVVDGQVREVIIVDGGSTDSTLEIADQAGARVITTSPSRGAQLKAGARSAKSSWLMFLHADTILQAGWEQEVGSFVEKVDSGFRVPSAAVFQFALDDDGFAPRVLEKLVRFRSRVLRKPYGDQGLLLPRALYDEVGGYQSIAMMEDLDLVHRLGRGRITQLHGRALTSAVRYRREGYVKRILRNQMCLLMYLFGARLSRISTLYQSQKN